MKIAIIGAGISGLSLYLQLAKLGLTEAHTVVIYESRSTSLKKHASQAEVETGNYAALGAGLGLGLTGLKVLKRLDAGLHDEVYATGHAIQSWRLSNARGWTLANNAVGEEGESVMIERNALVMSLEKRVPEAAVIRGRKLIGVIQNINGSPVQLEFDDGTTEEVDLVIGADGVWSRVRRAMFEDRTTKIYDYAPHYEGLIGCGGVVASSKLIDVPQGQMNVVFGRNGFMGYGYATCSEGRPGQPGDRAIWWSTYSLQTCPDDWRQLDRDAARRQLQARHASWKNASVQSLIADVEVESLYPTFITPLLPTWSNGGCALVGDAAHALQPSSGQGASMALEDGEALALLLQHYLVADSANGHQKAIKVYSDMRRPRLQMVYKKAQELAAMKEDMGIAMEFIMYFFIWFFNLFRFDKAYFAKLNQYDGPEQVAEAIRKAQ